MIYTQSQGARPSWARLTKRAPAADDTYSVDHFFFFFAANIIRIDGNNPF